jgi:threonine/homoserine/homoserine lactone efflux protein
MGPIVAAIVLRIYARVCQLRADMPDLLAFLGISLVVIMTPGQDTALTIRNTLVGGRGNGVRTACDALKLAGAAYLIVLGLQALRDAIRGGGHSPQALEPAPRHGFRQGLVSNLGNPKMAVFFTGLLPQFAPAGGGAFATMLALGVVFAGLTLAWLTLYAFAVERARGALARPAVRRALDAVMGTALIALGVRVAAAQQR